MSIESRVGLSLFPYSPDFNSLCEAAAVTSRADPLELSDTINADSFQGLQSLMENGGFVGSVSYETPVGACASPVDIFGPLDASNSAPADTPCGLFSDEKTFGPTCERVNTLSVDVFGISLSIKAGQGEENETCGYGQAEDLDISRNESMDYSVSGDEGDSFAGVAYDGKSYKRVALIGEGAQKSAHLLEGSVNSSEGNPKKMVVAIHKASTKESIRELEVNQHLITIGEGHPLNRVALGTPILCDDGRTGLMYPYYEHGDINGVLLRCTDEELEIMCSQAAKGLYQLHSNGVVHRDVHSENLLLGSQGVGLADLGKSCLVDADPHTVSLSLHNAYMAPEVQAAIIDYQKHKRAAEASGITQAVPGSANSMEYREAAIKKSLDIRADIYSLGVLLYTILYKIQKLSFEKWMRGDWDREKPIDPSLGEAEQLISSNEYIFRKKLNPERWPGFTKIPEKYHAILLQMLSPNPEKRPGLETVHKAFQKETSSPLKTTFSPSAIANRKRPFKVSEGAESTSRFRRVSLLKRMSTLDTEDSSSATKENQGHAL